jgi:hypothetical protein
MNARQVSICGDCGNATAGWDEMCECEICYDADMHNGWQCTKCWESHGSWGGANDCCQEHTPEGVTSIATAAIKKILFRNPVVSGISAGFIDKMDELAADGAPGVMEFTWRENPPKSGKYDLNPIGIINGFLALEDRTLYLKQDENDLDQIGLGISDDTRFLEPTGKTRYMPEPARYEDMDDQYKTPEGLTKIAQDMAMAVFAEIPLISGVPAEKVQEMDVAARDKNSGFDKMEFVWVESKTEEGKYDLFLIGVLNGFLLANRKKISPIVVHVGEEDGRFAGILITEEED